MLGFFLLGASFALYVQDGQTYLADEGAPRTDRALMPPMLDNLIHEKRVPPIVAVLVAPGPGGQRTIEYDTVSDRYTNFIVPEAAAAIRKTRRLIEPDICVTPKIRAAEPRPIIITLRCEFNAADPADP